MSVRKLTLLFLLIPAICFAGFGSDYFDFDTAPTSTIQEARAQWSAEDGTLSIGMPGGSVVGQVFQEMFVPKRPRNVSGAPMPNGTVVYISGETGAVPEISLADASTEILSRATIGLTTEVIGISSRGYVTTFGLVRDVDTSTFASGATLFLSETAGEFTDAKPATPAHAVVIGKVNRVHATEGEIIVNIINGWETYELHDVDDTIPTVQGQVSTWDTSNGYYTLRTSPLFDDTSFRFSLDNYKAIWGTGQDASVYYDGTNLIVDPKEVGTGIARVLGAVGIEELSADPADPAEGNAVLWMSDGTGTGDDGDLLYKEQSGTLIEQGSLKYKDFVPASITLNTGTYISGNAASVAEMMDGDTYHVDEVTGVPGFDIEFNFTGVDRCPNLLVARWIYNGSSTHFVTVDIYDYVAVAWHQVRVFKDSNAFFDSMTMYLPLNIAGNHVDGAGNMMVRFYHQTTGNASHDIEIDHIGLTHSLQGVI